MVRRECLEQALRNIISREKMRGSNSKYVYMRILSEIRAMAQPILSADELRSIRYVGEKTARRIQEALDRMEQAEDRENSGQQECLSQSEPVAALSGVGDFLSASLPVDYAYTQGRADYTQTIHSRPVRKYIPAYRSAAYAVLRVLHDSDGAHRHLVSLRAAPFTDRPLDSAAALRLLASRGLIWKDPHQKYFLTDPGRQLAGTLFSSMAPPAPPDDTVRLVIDSRERQSLKNTAYFQAYFNRLQIPNETRFLGLGDFLWLRQERVLGHIVERKAGGDFPASVADGRYREQKRRLLSLGLRTLYVVESLRPAAVNSSLIEYCLLETRLDGFTVVETDSTEETAGVLRLLDGRIRGGEEGGEMGGEMGYGSFIEEGSRAIDARGVLLVALLGIRGLNKQRAVALADEYGSMRGFQMRREADGRFAERLAGARVAGRVLGRRLAALIVQMLE